MISAMASQRKVTGTNGGKGNIPLPDSSENAIANVATAMATAKILFFIRAERYAGWGGSVNGRNARRRSSGDRDKLPLSWVCSVQLL